MSEFSVCQSSTKTAVLVEFYCLVMTEEASPLSFIYIILEYLEVFGKILCRCVQILHITTNCQLLAAFRSLVEFHSQHETRPVTASKHKGQICVFMSHLQLLISCPQ